MSSETNGHKLEAVPIAIRRITIALDCSSVNAGALATAVSLAAATHAELKAVFVEDECLYQLAQLPLARQVSRSGRAAEPFKDEDMSREIARAAEAARRMISAAAARENVVWTFATMRGQLDDTLHEVGESAEVLALGSSKAEIGRVHRIAVLRRSLRNGTGVIVAPPDFRPSQGPVFALIAPGADPGTVVRTAETLAERLNRRLCFAIAGKNRAVRDALEARVRDLVAEDATIVLCDNDTLGSVTLAVWRARASIVVADVDYSCFDEATSTERVCEAFDCPMLLVQV